MWAIFDKENKSAIWISENKDDLEKSLLDITNGLGDRFYISTYEKDQSNV